MPRKTNKEERLKKAIKTLEFEPQLSCIEELLKFSRYNVAPIVKGEQQIGRFLIYQMLAKCERQIPEPATPYPLAIAQEVTQHNARFEVRIKEIHTALNKVVPYSSINNIIHSYLFFDPLSIKMQEEIKRQFMPDPSTTNSDVRDQKPTRN